VAARIERLESYLADLEKEAAAVKEHIAEIKKSGDTESSCCADRHSSSQL